MIRLFKNSLALVLFLLPVSCLPDIPFIPIVHAAELTNSEKRDLLVVQDYLNNLTTMRAKFSQISPATTTAAGGGISEGMMYMYRPGRLRWEYETPSPVLIVLKGSMVTYYDKELEQVTYSPVTNTLANFIAEKDINLISNDKIDVVGVKRDASGIRVKLRERVNNPDEGAEEIAITLLTEPTTTLQSIAFTDEAGRTTTVAFENAEFGMTLDKDMFIFQDPRLLKRKKRN